MRIIDRTSYSQRETERKPRVIEFVEEQTGRGFKIHRHVDYPDTWLLSCAGLCDKVNLKTDDFDEAATKALCHVKKLAEKEIRGLYTLTSEIENVLRKKEKHFAPR